MEGEKTADVEKGHEIVDWDLQVRLESVLVAYWSPYPEVRAVTFPYDDPTIPAETFRVYLIAIIWTAIGAVINQFLLKDNLLLLLPCQLCKCFFTHQGYSVNGFYQNGNLKFGN